MYGKYNDSLGMSKYAHISVCKTLNHKVIIFTGVTFIAPLILYIALCSISHPKNFWKPEKGSLSAVCSKTRFASTVDSKNTSSFTRGHSTQLRVRYGRLCAKNCRGLSFRLYVYGKNETVEMSLCEHSLWYRVTWEHWEAPLCVYICYG